MMEIRQIVENAQFFETITAKTGVTQDIDKLTGDELELLLDLDDDDLWNELLALYKQNPIAVTKE
jgi:hypothetical protein